MKNRIARVIEPYKIIIEDKEVRPFDDNEAVVKVKSSSICGSDLHIFKGKHPAVKLPTTIGHEFSGDIVAIGKDNHGFKVGDRVTLEPIINCGKCPACLSGNYGQCENASFSYRIGDGAMADYVVCRSEHLFKLKDNMSYDIGSLIEPLSVANRAVKRSNAKKGDSVIIYGAGTIGLFIAAILSYRGIDNISIVDLSEARLDAASKLGVSRTINPSKDSNDSLYDIAFEVIGKEATFNSCLECLKVDGTLVQVGIFENPNITFNASILINKQIRIVGTQGYNNDFEEALEIATHVNLEQLITHIYPLSKLEEAIKCNIDAVNTNAIKVLIHPEEE